MWSALESYSTYSNRRAPHDQHRTGLGKTRLQHCGLIWPHNKFTHFGLTNKRAFVGGGSRGIGKAIAIELAKEVMVIASGASRLWRKRERNRAPDNSLSVGCNLREQVDSTMDEGVQQLGGLDILINSASSQFPFCGWANRWVRRGCAA